MPYSLMTGSLPGANVEFNTLYPPAISVGGKEKTEENHDKLLGYLLARLKSAAQIRSARIRRYGRIDMLYSTWQRLSNEDTQRKVRQEATGASQALHMNLPLGQIHVEDMTAYFAEIFAPEAGAFFRLPKTQTQAQSKALVDKLNQDAKQEKLFKNLVLTLKRLLKYNVGGFDLGWYVPTGAQAKDGRNCWTGIDPYNHLYDVAIQDPSELAKKGEWSATVDIRDQRYLLNKQNANEFFGIGAVIETAKDGNGFTKASTDVMFYKYSPAAAGLMPDDGTTQLGTKMDWSAWGASLPADQAVTVPGWEEIHMYCWINSHDFGIVDKNENNYTLWEFTILDGKRIISAEQVGAPVSNTDPAAALTEHYQQIPHYLGFLNLDDMGESQRSVVELIVPFASFGSFLMNAHIDATRAAIFGLTIYDPLGVDLSNIPKGETTARIATKQPGRDVRTIVQNIQTNVDSSGTMEQLSQLISLMDRFFPSQSMPSQVASIDRAVTNQVAAVVQGASRKLHMVVRTVDDDIMGPARYASFVNISANQAADITGLTDGDVLQILGSGLQQLNTEAAAGHIKELIFALLQNPNSAAEYDVAGLMNLWSGMLNIPDDLTQFKKQPAAAPGALPAAAAPGAAIADPAIPAPTIPGY